MCGSISVYTEDCCAEDRKVRGKVCEYLERVNVRHNLCLGDGDKHFVLRFLIEETKRGKNNVPI